MQKNLLRTHRFVAVCGATSLLLASCAPSNIPKLESCFYPQCAEPLIEMQKRDSKVVTTTATSAAGGALLGGLGAALTSGNRKEILRAAAVGALAGGVAGFTYAKVKQISDENQRFASLRVVANQDLSKATRLQLYAYECMYCYIREFDGLQADYENGLVGKEEYAERFREIHRAMIALGETIGKMDGDIQRTEREFNETIARGPSEFQDWKDFDDPAPPSKVTRKKDKKGSAKVVKGKKRKQVQQVQAPQRPSQRLMANLDKSKQKVKQMQTRNESEAALIKRDIEGQANPPRQDVQGIRKQYSEGYAITRKRQDELESAHREAMSIMDEAATKSGIDMV